MCAKFDELRKVIRELENSYKMKTINEKDSYKLDEYKGAILVLRGLMEKTSEIEFKHGKHNSIPV